MKLLAHSVTKLGVEIPSSSSTSAKSKLVSIPACLSYGKMKSHHFIQLIVSLYAKNPFVLHLSYFIFLSLIGFLLLDVVLPMKDSSSVNPRPISHLDLLFTSISAATVSSMTVVEMESFSNSQLTVLTLLMLLGGEVFLSMLSLLFLNTYNTNNNNNSNSNIIGPCPQLDLELASTTIINPTTDDDHDHHLISNNKYSNNNNIIALRYLGYVVLGYLVVVHVTASSLILVYLSLFPSQKAVLRRKGLRTHTFAFFVVVSSFANCGFVPTNENMIVFRNCTGLLSTVAVVVLLGNTMYPIGLRFVVWALSKISKREDQFGFILSTSGEELGYDHLMSGLEVAMLGATVTGFILLQFILFCCLEWQSDQGLEGMSTYEKVVGALFMSVNSRHAGESVVDLSAVSPAILTLYVVMMYLPPYTTFLPIQNYKCKSNSKEEEEEEEKYEEKKKKKSKLIIENLLVFSQLSYLAIFVIIICITERNHISKDPLNFNVLNIVFEVISAYGNVGFSTGYSCERQLDPKKQCKDLWIGFSGKWSNKGKLTLMAVMLFGRHKKFSMRGGKAWKLR